MTRSPRRPPAWRRSRPSNGTCRRSGRADLVLEIHQHRVALGRAVELDDLGNREAPLERLPDVGAQAVTERHTKPMLAIVRPLGLVQQVTAELPDVLEARGLLAPDIVEELAGAELSPERDRRASRDRARNH